MVSPNEFLRTEMNVLSRGFIPEEEVAAAERQPIAMVRSHISWGGIIAGSLLTFSLLVLSGSFAYACGIPAFTDTGPYGIGAGLWSVLTAIVAFGSGGWLSACLASTLDRRYRFLHGVATWALTIPLLMILTGGGIGLMGGMLAENVREMVLIAPRLGGAWGAFISMTVGLVAAICGGALLDVGLRQYRGVETTKTTVMPTGP